MPNAFSTMPGPFEPATGGFQQLMQVEIIFQSSELAVRDALARMISELEVYNLDPEETGTVQLVAAEVLNNIVEHAYPPETSSGPIRLRCGFQDDGLHLHISDQGAAMPEGRLPLGNRPNLDTDLDDLPEGGFGWFMIQDLAKDVEYRRENDENHLHLRIAIEARRLN